MFFPKQFTVLGFFLRKETTTGSRLHGWVAPGSLLAVQVNFYGYTFGKNWASTVSGRKHVYLKWLLCFDHSLVWYVNEEPKGAGVVDHSVPIFSIDLIQEREMGPGS